MDNCWGLDNIIEAKRSNGNAIATLSLQNRWWFWERLLHGMCSWSHPLLHQRCLVRTQKIKNHWRYQSSQKKSSHPWWYFILYSGSFALWAGLFSITDCTLIGIRKEEGAINQIIAGAVTGGLLAFRSGARVAFKNAIFGGMILGSIVIVERLIMKYQSIKQR